MTSHDYLSDVCPKQAPFQGFSSVIQSSGSIAKGGEKSEEHRGKSFPLCLADHSVLLIGWFELNVPLAQILVDSYIAGACPSIVMALVDSFCC
jgi:hypothetical protein